MEQLKFDVIIDGQKIGYGVPASDRWKIVDDYFFEHPEKKKDLTKIKFDVTIDQYKPHTFVLDEKNPASRLCAICGGEREHEIHVPQLSR